MDLCLVSVFLLGLLSFNWSSEAAITAWTLPGPITGASGSISATAIPENPVEGAVLFTAKATTAVNYTLTGNAGGKGTINSTSGVVTLAKGQIIDFETTTSLQFLVVATDSTGSNGTANITLPITNVNEAPAFSSATETACIKDNSPAGTTLGTYIATDPDIGNTITYSITSGNSNTDFDISGKGVITVATGKTLSKASTATYILVVNATDSPSPHLNGSTIVSVTVGDCSGAGMVTALMYLMFAVVVTTQLL
ncbi:protocadherin-like wing polarity protein stan [Mya arenaria]|uniref:protocadherin-like wing polarity protein stan n=1 Tax=Mya arenaria TaxID=6604 RepID=UPI0022E8900D|nr:protocadherin-like wing polarity protein stan [Mya arenaria]